ncbi:MAG: hypothetical protein B7Z55_16935 [Planctomycetales bacterium 12-60-4]|nr:MAG: hypothetical protein B7Z55_16935 [Planctomycetales bacterium 12-60-4]
MDTKDAIRGALNLSSTVLSSYIGDLSDAELLRRPAPGCNHIAWQLGHLVASEVGLLNGIQPGAGAELPAGFAEKHSKDKIGSDNPADFCTKQEYLDLAEKVHAATLKLLDAYPEADFDKPSPENFRSLFPTMGSMFLLIATHPMMHAGQFVPVRRALGKPVVI